MRPWQGSTRLARLPKDWQRRRQAVIRRDGGRCRRCGAPAREVDHVVPGDDHTLANLQLLCGRCHLTKSAREGSTAAAAARTRHPSYRRPPEPHPGTIHPRRPTMTSTEPIEPDVEPIPETEPAPDDGDQGDDDEDDDGA
jgi:hypothetical protein